MNKKKYYVVIRKYENYTDKIVSEYRYVKYSSYNEVNDEAWKMLGRILQGDGYSRWGEEYRNDIYHFVIMMFEYDRFKAVQL